MRIELQNIHKYYGVVKANAGITMTLLPGEIHGILGENGAGKSTLMKILSGFIQKTSGTIVMDGKPAECQTPAQARRLGIGMLYQDPLDFPLLSVLDNFMLGSNGSAFRGKARKKNTFTALINVFNFNLNPSQSVSSLTVGERQQLEIVRLMSRGIQVLILDEPTAGLSSQQKEVLFRSLKQIAAENKTIVVVSHKVKDLQNLCDRITVLRSGVVSAIQEKPFDIDNLLKMMFGGFPQPISGRQTNTGETILQLDDVTVPGGRTGLKHCTANVFQGEKVGLAGMESSGQEVFLRVAAGLYPVTKGQILFTGESMKGKDYPEFRKRGVAFLPAARFEEGLIAGMTIAEHIALKEQTKHFIIEKKQTIHNAKKYIKRFHIKGESESLVESLSGGNQQRLLLSLLPDDSRLLLLENPTRGLDLEAKHWVWQYFDNLCANKTGIVFSSPELDELLIVADRVLVFFEGQIIMNAKTEDIDDQMLSSAIAGEI